MKRVIALSLAALLAGTTVASAGSYRGWSRGHHNGWSHHRGGNDAALGIGLGVLALGALAVISSQKQSLGCLLQRPRPTPPTMVLLTMAPIPITTATIIRPVLMMAAAMITVPMDNGGYYSSPYDNGPGYPAYDDDDYGD
jgi:hypothetical protein